jgi:hypothetical protein
MTLQAALEYVQRGWSVFPLGPPTPATAEKKGEHGRPLVAWKHLQERRTTVAEVRQWWKQWPNAGVAIVTGRISGIVVVDVDPKHGGTSEGLPHTDCVALTGSGGKHHVYRYPASAKSVACQVNPDDSPDPIRRGRDVRADGGYINAAPSLHYSGRNYSWESFGELGEPPEWALTPIAKVSDDKHQDKWLTRLLEKGPSFGERNISLTRVAGYFAAKGIPLDIGMVLCRQWLADVIDDSDFSDSEVETTVRSAYRTEARRNPERFKQRTKGGTARQLFKTLTLSQFMRKYGEHEIRWTVEDWLPESTIGFIASPPGGFKTWMTFDLAASVASGRPFLDRYPVSEPGPVILVQQEDFNAQTAARNALVLMSRLKLAPPDINALDEGVLDVPVMPGDDELPLHFHADRQLRFDDPQVMDALEEAVKSIRPKLVICDPFYQLVTTDEYMARAAADMSRLKTMRDAYGTSFMLVHHTTKGGENEWGRSKLWGSQFLNAFAETLWHIRRPEDEEFNIVKRTFKLGGVQQPVRIDFAIDSPRYKYNVRPETISKEEAERLIKAPHQAPARRLDSLSKKIVDSLSTLPDGLTSLELADMLGSEANAIEKAARKAAQAGDIHLDAFGRWRHSVPDLG